jgi:DNA end-binding protein Ku
MPRAVWTGSVSFGLVTIPARLYPATEPKDVRFHLTDDRGRRIRYRRFVADDEPAPAAAPADNDPSRDEEASAQRSDEDGTRVSPSPGAAEEKEIAFHDLLRGYETDDGRLVVLGRDEIEAARPEPSRTIEIEDFVDLVDIDPVYFDKSYVLAPQGGAEKPYVLLLRAMEQAGRIGIGRSCSAPSRISWLSGRPGACSAWRRCSSVTRFATPARSSVASTRSPCQTASSGRLAC